MTKEEKQLLLKDLSARLSYGVICHTDKGDGYLCSINQTIFGTEYGLNINPLKRDYFNDSEQDEVVIKPYLRPMSSMTEEEEILFRCELPTKAKTDAQLVAMRMELFLKGHLDYNHLIEKGLALEALEWMYKEDLTMSWNFYPEDRFSSYDDYVKYLKEKGFALEAPKGVYKED